MVVLYNELGKKVEYSFNTFSDRIDSILDLMHIKKIRFYADLKISRTTSINWKKGTIPLGETFMKIANYLDVDPYWLLTGELKDPQTGIDAKAQAYRVYYKLKSMTAHNESHKDFYMPLKNCIDPILLIKWSNGIQIPTIYKLREISAELNMPFLYLLDGSVQDNDIKKDGVLRYYDFLSKEKQDAIDTIILDGYYRQLWDREHQSNPDEILTDKDPYDDPNSGFNIED